jgi:hypothetical protein
MENGISKTALENRIGKQCWKRTLETGIEKRRWKAEMENRV